MASRPRDSFLSFPDRSGESELGFLMRGGIDLRNEMTDMLNRHGHKVFLRRASDQRCPSWREDRREPHPESCPYCWNGWMYQDELVLTYRRPALGLVAEGLVDTIRAPFGQITARQTIFYFTHDVAPSVRDAIIYVTLDGTQEPIQPFNIERIWQIEMTEDFRDRLGRIEYWAVMAEQRSIGK